MSSGVLLFLEAVLPSSNIHRRYSKIKRSLAMTGLVVVLLKVLWHDVDMSDQS